MRAVRLGLAATALTVLVVAVGCGSNTDVGGIPTSSPNPSPSPTATPAAATYPIVLMHGLGGDSAANGVYYFNDIPPALTADGWTVFAPSVDPFNAVAVRAGQWATAIDQILAQTGATKVHLIAHSQGGLDARYLISSLGYGPKVASLTTIGTPHHGTLVADLAIGLIPGNVAGAMSAISDAIFDGVTESAQNTSAAIIDLSQNWCDNTFNPANPDDPAVTYYSVQGAAHSGYLSPVLAPSWGIELVLQGSNDGLVPISSATWGQSLGVIESDHLYEINQPPGTNDPAFSALPFYQALAKYVEGVGPPP